ncbi:SlyX protein [Pseudooceanicola sp. 216_PA32_1]|jgi:SlyX protein|uniref:SlyX protein n=1 Tax=Pseudooceanicola pacificus TaxID=2676438 RepID=A0A844W9F3_9RHOB|nr:SlyX family protein [Pseudooceanicola pacificus]MWB79825.1 SlyX protein [Pseudooceanicola pacificus]
MLALEEQVAHLQRNVDELSDIVTRQQTEIAMLTRRVQLLMEREAERESQAGMGVHMGDEKPPHW